MKLDKTWLDLLELSDLSDKSNIYMDKNYIESKKIYDSNLDSNLKINVNSIYAAVNSNLSPSALEKVASDFIDYDSAALLRMNKFVVLNKNMLSSDKRLLLHEHLSNYFINLENLLNLRSLSESSIIDNEIPKVDLNADSDISEHSISYLANLHNLLKSSDTSMRYVISSVWNFDFYGDIIFSRKILFGNGGK